MERGLAVNVRKDTWEPDVNPVLLDTMVDPPRKVRTERGCGFESGGTWIMERISLLRVLSDTH
jgi:hypothetical protein